MKWFLLRFGSEFYCCLREKPISSNRPRSILRIALIGICIGGTIFLDERRSFGSDQSLYEVSVSDFGAKGDGKKDDWEAIQSSVRAVCMSERGGVVYFPAGVFAISRAIEVCSGISIVGSGEERSTIVPIDDGFRENFFEYTGGEDLERFSISDVGIVGDIGGRRVGEAGIFLASASRVLIDRVKIFRVGGDGIFLGAPQLARSSRVAFSHVREVGGHGILILAHDPWLVSSVIADSVGSGIVIEGVSAKILNNHIGRSGIGMADLHLKEIGALVSNNVFEEGLSSGVLVDLAEKVAMTVIDGNRFRVKSDDVWAIELSGNGVVVSSNVVSGSRKALLVNKKSANVSISNNIFFDGQVEILADGVVVNGNMGMR